MADNKSFFVCSSVNPGHFINHHCLYKANTLNSQVLAWLLPHQLPVRVKPAPQLLQVHFAPPNTSFHSYKGEFFILSPKLAKFSITVLETKQGITSSLQKAKPRTSSRNCNSTPMTLSHRRSLII